jgi:hypothetical protein
MSIASARSRLAIRFMPFSYHHGEGVSRHIRDRIEIVQGDLLDQASLVEAADEPRTGRTSLAA